MVRIIKKKIRKPRMASHHVAAFIRIIRNTDPVPVFNRSANRLLIGRSEISKNQPSFFRKIREADPWKCWKIKDFWAFDITREYEIFATPKEKMSALADGNGTRNVEFERCP